MGFTYENAVRLLVRGAQRLTGRLARKRSGYVFIWIRAILARLERVARRTPVAPEIDLVTLDGLPARAAGASYRELEPPAVGATPRRGWMWPPTFVPVPHPHAVATRGEGVVEIPGGVVFGSQGRYGSDASGLLAEACLLWPNTERAALVDTADALAVGLEELDGVTMSLWANGDNYAHCLLQSVPRLDLLRRAFGLEADRFLVDDAAPAPTVEALEILGVSTDRVHLVPRRAPAYRCETLRAATWLLSHDVGVPWTATFLNELFLPDPPHTSSRRIYVSRGAVRRAVLNEEKVLALLEPLGFEVVTMDGRSTREQAALFASAAVIVAAHGAALSNIVFCRPDTAVIELMGTNTAATLFAFLAWRRGLNYQMIMGTEPAPPRTWWTWQIDADTVVDVRGLENCLEKLALA